MKREGGAAPWRRREGFLGAEGVESKIRAECSADPIGRQPKDLGDFLSRPSWKGSTVLGREVVYLRFYSTKKDGESWHEGPEEGRIEVRWATLVRHSSGAEAKILEPLEDFAAGPLIGE